MQKNLLKKNGTLLLNVLCFYLFLFIIIIIIIVVVLNIINTYIILFKTLNTLFFLLVSRGPWKKQHPTAIHFNHNFRGKIIYIYMYIRVVTVHVLVPESFGTDISVQYACVPNKYSIVLTTAQMELHWTLLVLYTVTFD